MILKKYNIRPFVRLILLSILIYSLIKTDNNLLIQSLEFSFTNLTIDFNLGKVLYIVRQTLPEKYFHGLEEIHVSNDLGVGIKDENYEMNKLKNGQEFCWVHLQDMKIKNNDNGTIPLTTGMRKVITMSTKKNKSSTSSNNKKKRKKEKLNNSQPKLSQYFKQQNEK